MYGYNYTSVNGPDNEDRSSVKGLFRRMNTPVERLEHTLGSYNFYVDENGNTIVEDTYDFNDHQRQHGDSKYASLRNWAG